MLEQVAAILERPVQDVRDQVLGEDFTVPRPGEGALDPHEWAQAVPTDGTPDTDRAAAAAEHAVGVGGVIPESMGEQALTSVGSKSVERPHSVAEMK